MKKVKVLLMCFLAAVAVTFVAACGDDKKPADANAEYTVTFDTAGGGLLDAQTVKSGESASKPDDPSKIGWVFKGWYLGDDEYTFAEKVTEDITLTARYDSVLGGEGTATNPFTIDTAEELTVLTGYIEGGATEFLSAVYIQTADITSALTAPISRFSGIYDGKDYKLNLGAPLFGALSGTVKNLKISGNIAGDGAAGLLANTADGAIISRVTADGSVKNENGFAGGIVGVLESGRLELCEVSASVSGKIAGGVAGRSYGVIINNSVTGNIDGTVCGGIAGVLESGALVQNCGFGGSVSAEECAGGIVGRKFTGSSVYRGFTYGKRISSNGSAGAIVGWVERNLIEHEDTLGCVYLYSTLVRGNKVFSQGEEKADELSTVALPQGVWRRADGIPVLKDEITYPESVIFNKGNNSSTVPYGSHVEEELFTSDNLHFSQLNEIDTTVTLKAITQVSNSQLHGEYTDAYSTLEFIQNGAKYKADKDAQLKNLTYVESKPHTAALIYTPDFTYPDSTYQVVYDMPVHVYSDGETEYAFVIEKEYIGPQMYVGYLYSYVKTQDGWIDANTWYPKAPELAGVYTYTTGTYPVVVNYVMIDGNYTVEDGEGYYLTRYSVKGSDKYIMSRGKTAMYLGNSESNIEYNSVLVYTASADGYVDFIYYGEVEVKDDNAEGEEDKEPVFETKLLNSSGSEVTPAPADFLKGNWFDGKNKFVFDFENGKVISGTNEAEFTVEGQVISFELNSKKYSLMFVPTPYGAYTLKDNAESELILVTYIDNAFDGEWITDNGDIISVVSSPAANVTFNGVPVQVADMVYNGQQALYFTDGNTEYYLVKLAGNDNVNRLYANGKSYYAVNTQTVAEKFQGEYVSVRDGVRYELNVKDDLTVEYKEGDGAKQTGKLLPTFAESGTDGEYGIAFELGGAKFNGVRKNDTIVLTRAGVEYAFTDKEIFSRFVVTYTSGTEMLQITANGTFARYNRGETPTEFINLTAEYREERYLYGQEDRGFVLSYIDNGEKYFFYADIDAHNIRLFREFISPVSGNAVTQRVWNFIPENEIADIFHSYERTLNDAPDTLTFSADDYTLKRTYTDEKGVKHEDVEIDWYPVLNYNYNSQTSTMVAYTLQYDDGAAFETQMSFTLVGLSWGMSGSWINVELVDTFNPFIEKVYIGNERDLINISSERLTLTQMDAESFATTSTTYIFDSITIEDGVLTITMTQSLASSGDKKATAILTKAGEAFKLDITISDGYEAQFTGETPLSYKELLGEYVYNGKSVIFSAEESWLGISIMLTYDGKTFYYSESNGVSLMSNGSQALYVKATREEKYIWKDGSNLKISDTLDASKAITAENAITANMPTFDKLQEILGATTFTANDGSVITFNYVTEGWGAPYLEIVDGDIETYLTDTDVARGEGIYELPFIDDMGMSEDRYVIVHFNAKGEIVKLLVGETKETATKEYRPPVQLPTADELMEILNGMEFSSVDGETVSFTYTTGYFGGFSISMSIGDFNEFSNEDGVKNENSYTYYFGYSNEIEATVILADDGSVEKVTVDNIDYFPAA